MSIAPHAPLVICSKSRWAPAIRREHALAQLAAEAGHRVVFVEAPEDVRTARTNPRRWLERLVTVGTPATVAENLVVVERSTVIPGHRNQLAHIADAGLLRRLLRALVAAERATVVATTPWQWRAVAPLAGVRRVFDCADDWSEVIPARAAWFRSLYERVAVEADAVIVNNAPLARRFPQAQTVVVANGTSGALLATPITPQPGTPTMAYAGTLSERFDAPLVAAVMSTLPAWRLDLYGECRYAGCGERPGEELRALIAHAGGRVVWHGVVARAELATRLDAASVLVLPHRPLGAITGDAMKLYDYAARGRPIVSTRWSPSLADSPTPGVRLAETAAEWVTALTGALADPPHSALARREWAEANAWTRRWPQWSQALFGTWA